ncbi:MULTISPECIES: LytTR family transcriptional regulator DNA-binding domain-containing protein [Furfurilactobacillus]|uniref:LytTR family transcriptional regulator DNA-binding domain-containing protein n=2 Tax=Furfurilactobacillus TaxID=2767882 RepID=A0ABT6DDE1_9LACO|nr:LytTR family transcriptional regulator DNA-binding domain-containing protein [Furfurilactobacillus milii]QLE65672.1 Autolysis response regulater LytR [Furfurilactobacillus rossiae]MCF6161848.1 LytTR family transcriptional regulator DNA-binding domain-containing protein [Furfurilactobacillus milii]MCF6164228.1 LytTR family transcriptional regulator DNA-binding domain-containing protein [Furfurilactobacillus milii]MDF9914770.1 LytTR family transcriptional regulator DNA-binding domain-containin
MKVLIVDDEPLARNELEYLLKQNPLVDQVSQAESISQALAQLLTTPSDLVFLDISLNNENGFDLADKLDQLANPPLVVVATAYDDYAVRAFNINAVDYVLKPFEQQRINQALSRVDEVLQLREEANPVVKTKPRKPLGMISITENEKTRVLKQGDILAGFVENGELILTTKDGRFHTHQTLSWLMTRLSEDQFMQVHRSIVVNITAISEVEPWFNHTYQIKLTNGDKVPVSRSFVKSMKDRLNM